MTYNLRLFIFLVIGFISATVIGTLSHEFGHYAVAEYLGYDASINYGSTALNHTGIIPAGDRFLITLGGPAETILTGTVGVILLLLYRKSYRRASQLNFKQWTIVFCGSFLVTPIVKFILDCGGLHS